MLMNTIMDLLQFCALDIHIISDIEKQESFVRLRPKLDIPYYYTVAWHSRTSFTSRPLHSYQARPRHNSHTDEFTIIVTPITQNEIHSSLQFLNHHNNRIIARYITAMDTYWRWSITHFLEIAYYFIRLKKRLKRPLAVWFQLWRVSSTLLMKHGALMKRLMSLSCIPWKHLEQYWVLRNATHRVWSLCRVIQKGPLSPSQPYTF